MPSIVLLGDMVFSIWDSESGEQKPRKIDHLGNSDLSGLGKEVPNPDEHDKAVHLRFEVDRKSIKAKVPNGNVVFCYGERFVKGVDKVQMFAMWCKVREFLILEYIKEFKSRNSVNTIEMCHPG